MLVRRIKNEELKRTAELSYLAFEGSMDNSQTAEEYYEKKIAEPQSRVDTDAQCYRAAFADDDRTMMSAMCAIPYTVFFDGHTAAMQSIGNVCTLPMYRRSGGIRACFQALLPDMYAQGVAFSYLYPFSTAYYRRFGYEIGCGRQLLKLNLSAIPKWALGGNTALLEQGNDLTEDIKAIYNVWAQHYNMMTQDELPIDYHWTTKANPFKDKEYTYLYYSADGEPKGYMTFKPDNEHERDLSCSRFFFTDVEGFKGLLSLLKTFKSDHPTVSFMLPSDIWWRLLIPEQSFGLCECKDINCGMVRVINVAQVLRMASSKGSGSLVLDITDAQIPQNNGRFEVRFADGATADVGMTDKEPDLRMGINDFSRLILGRYDTEALAYMDGVEVLCPPDKAAKLIFKKPQYITRYF